MSASKQNSNVFRIEAETPLPTWPVLLMIAFYPLWFLLGIAGFMWVVLAIPMAVYLVRRRNLVAPAGFGLWMLFLVAVLGSGLSIDTAPRMSGYVLRFGYYIGATIFLLYLINGGESVSTSRIIRVFTFFWMAVVVGGYLAFFIGEFSFNSPMAYLMPSALLENELIATLVRPGFADVQDIVGFPVPRPKAPFPYTNSWGSMLALLTPFGFMALHEARTRFPPRLINFFLVASIIPGVVSLNRGLWLSLGIGMLYVSFRLGVAGQRKAISRIIAVFVLFVALYFATPLGGLVAARLDSGHSDEDRGGLAVSAIEGSIERPVFGWGAPRPNVRNLPPIGTHGQLWNLLFATGFIGAIGWVGALFTFFFKTRRQRTLSGMWAHTVLLISLVQLPFYLQVPHQLFVVMAAVAVSFRMLEQDKDIVDVDQKTLAPAKTTVITQV